MIILEKVSKSFTTEHIETQALNAIDLEIDAGDFIAVTGPSGSGKSTLLNVLGLLEPINSGNYWFEGKNLNALSPNRQQLFRKKNIGFIFQNFNLIDELSVFENIELPLIYQGRERKARHHRVDELMERLGIAHRSSHMPQQLSGGQQQRVAIARALSGQPKIILADEPTGNLDSSIGKEVMLLLRELNAQGATILMVTHSKEHANYAGRLIQMKDGFHLQTQN
ncbi:ABC transporter ATP-binding protein [Rheinheimera sp. YQF-2]|uniref:ABC transporter ATP-binding protein n=1 Tax=Rheinheimera lutimaris TaxID=2740584 RepID=A0A7Y5AU45_9GAMM|nr:ABC transporter ATP-binding protein [Rheinheimera lutimaris]NRQ44374.1 ABC transporter ATP-binding protein [Rheinheimera lutimaris]